MTAPKKQPTRPWKFMLKDPGEEPFVHSSFATREAAEARVKKLQGIWAEGVETYVELR